MFIWNQNKNLQKDTDEKCRENIFKKFRTILSVLLILLIPIGLSYCIIEKRIHYRTKITNSFGHIWAGEQVLEAPKLTIGDKELILNQYNVDINLETQIRKKGIFKVPIYIADVKLGGNFLNEDGPLNNKTVFSFKVKDSKGFVEEPLYQLNNLPVQKTQNAVVDVNLNTKSSNIPFSISYKLKGIKTMSLYTKGKYNNIKISGNYGPAGFSGKYLPDVREAGKDSFKAEWVIQNFLRFYKADGPEIETHLPLLDDNYEMTLDAFKYSFLFSILIFICYFIFEITSKEKFKIQPFQYFFSGVILQMFYVLLMAFSDFIPFLLSYIISALMIISLISVYTYYVITKTKEKFFTIIVASLMLILYIFLYIIIKYQDLALLIASLGMFLMVCIIMYAMHNINEKENT